MCPGVALSSLGYPGCPWQKQSKKKNLKTIDLKNGERRTFKHGYRKLIYSSWYICYGKQYKDSL